MSQEEMAKLITNCKALLQRVSNGSLAMSETEAKNLRQLQDAWETGVLTNSTLEAAGMEINDIALLLGALDLHEQGL